MGAHLLPKTGKENKLPTTATAHKIPATHSFFVRVSVIKKTPFHSFENSKITAFSKIQTAPMGLNIQKIRSKLTGFLSRRNTASHRCYFCRTQGAPPLSFRKAVCSLKQESVRNTHIHFFVFFPASASSHQSPSKASPDFAAKYKRSYPCLDNFLVFRLFSHRLSYVGIIQIRFMGRR